VLVGIFADKAHYLQSSMDFEVSLGLSFEDLPTFVVINLHCCDDPMSDIRKRKAPGFFLS